MSTSVSRQTNSVPEAVARVARLMASFRAPWALCGGWAVDAWLGRQTRDHPDVDISIFHDDHRAIFDHLAGWRLVAHDHTDTHQPWDGRHLDLPNHIQASLDADERPEEGVGRAPQQGLSLDFQLDQRSGGDWILSREPRVSLPRRDGVRQSPWGLPAVVPEVLLFFKARDPRLRDKLDFAALLPLLAQEQRTWLRDAIAAVGHPWLARLSR